MHGSDKPEVVSVYVSVIVDMYSSCVNFHRLSDSVARFIEGTVQVITHDFEKLLGIVCIFVFDTGSSSWLFVVWNAGGTVVDKLKLWNGVCCILFVGEAHRMTLREDVPVGRPIRKGYYIISMRGGDGL